MSVPEEYGGLGLPVFDTALILEEIAKVCYVTAMAVLGEAGVQTRVIAPLRARHRSRSASCPASCTGDCMLAVCMTEPHAGTDVANYRTNARDAGDRRHPERHQDAHQPRPRSRHVRRLQPRRRQPGREGIGCVLSRAAPRASRSPAPITPWAARTCTRSSSTIASCRWRILSSRRTAFSAAQRVQHATLPQPGDLARPRRRRVRRSGELRPRAYRVRPADRDFQGIRWKLADMFKDIEAGRGLLYRACVTADPFPDPFLAATAKIFCNEMSVRVTSEASRCMAAMASPTNIRSRASIAARATARSAAAHRGDPARPDRQEDRRPIRRRRGIMGLGNALGCVRRRLT